MVAAPIGVSGLVGGLSATVAFGRVAVGGVKAGAVGAPVGAGVVVFEGEPGSGVFAVLRAMVGAPTGALEVASLMVGAPIGPAVLSGMVGAGCFGDVGAPVRGADAVRGLGAPGAVGLTGAGVDGDSGGFGAVGAAEGAAGACAVGTTGTMGGLVGAAGVSFTGASELGVPGNVAEGTAGGASEALRVTRTVSFFKGMLEVFLEAGWFSFSLMRGGFCGI